MPVGARNVPILTEVPAELPAVADEPANSIRKNVSNSSVAGFDQIVRYVAPDTPVIMLFPSLFPYSFYP